MLNGSPNPNGNTNAALEEIALVLKTEGVESEIFQLGNGPIRDCIACGGCAGKDRCVFTDDKVNDFTEKAADCDGFIFGTPVYYAHPTGRVLSFLDRVFYSASGVFAFKPAASVVVARRGGCSASFDVLNKYFGISRMPVAGSTYWNMVHGLTPGEAAQDLEGMQTMRNLARQLSWMMKCFALGRENGVPLPETERGNVTHFIR